ncbi:transcriptional regulator [Aestuariivivens sediminis]|uniref:transcriptional regulator n=1 Tax=Aestuariivivens sediminis TaxID=2913557 RepID=UPI001F56C5AA|nr:transcriptional regulator [Aestuariivivens sediminis]
MTTSVITGDIIKSRTNLNPDVWISALKEALSYLSPNNKYWNIYRGDSFQLELSNFTESFKAAVYIKACIKSFRGLDVRISIGIGEKTYEGNNVMESNGEAFVFSGETLETLKKEKQNLRIKTNHKALDDELNLCFRLALIAMDKWTVNAAEIVKLTMEHPKALQSELGQLVGINQNAVSSRQKRAHLEEIFALNRLYQEKTTHYLK